MIDLERFDGAHSQQENSGSQHGDHVAQDPTSVHAIPRTMRATGLVAQGDFMDLSDRSVVGYPTNDAGPAP
jgi:hypothetical protein